MNAATVVKASEKFVRVIVRRPHAYKFVEKDKTAAVPGIVFLDQEGNVVGSVQLDSAEKLVEKMNKLVK